MIAARLVLTAAVVLFVAAAPVDLRLETLKAFERYIQLTEARIATEISGASPWLWIDRRGEAQRQPIMNRLGRGEVVVEPLLTKDGAAEIDVPDGLIHHWIGTVLMPNTKLDRVIAFVQDYSRYSTVFAPMIQQARILKQAPDRFDITTRTWTRKVIEVVMEADYTVEYQRLGPTKVYSRSVASNIQEIKSPGKASERKVPAAQGQGFMWRLNNYCSFEERMEGVYEQCESVSLSRSVPLLLRPIVNPIAKEMPREALSFSLGKVRAGVK